jgi:tetratricopeptide (TPR) repeat protein
MDWRTHRRCFAILVSVLAGVVAFDDLAWSGSSTSQSVTAEGEGTYRPSDEGNCWTSPPLLAPAQARATDQNIVDVCTRLLEWQLKKSSPGGEILRSYSSRSGAYRRLGQLDEAMADSQSTLKYSSDGASHIAIGQIHLDKKEYAKALEAFDAYKSPAPFSDQMLGRAQALEGLGRKKEAIAAYKEYEKVSGDGMMGYSVKKTVNEALIRLGDREAPTPVAPPAGELAPPTPPAPPSGGGGSRKPGLGNIL